MSTKSKLALALVGLATSASAATPPTATVESGRLQGVTLPDAPVQVFRGIPYAAAPVGVRRWQPPQPALRWSGTRQADQFGNRCMQPKLWADMIFRSPAMSEDCLYLNVWAPAGAGKGRKLPVLFYIHGGGFVAGDGSERRYDGAATAAKGVVVVTLNYRLGVFGAFAHPELSAGSAGHGSGNQGMLDQAAALAWVNRNIAAFGGDPAHVTIGGESAGSMSVSVLMASRLTRNLIAGAIGESGALLRPLAPRTVAEAEQSGNALASGIGAKDLAALQALPADRLLVAQSESAQRLSFLPVLDNHLLTEPLGDTFAMGRAAHVPLLVGSNSQENSYQSLIGDVPPTLANYRAALSRLFADRADALFALYPAATDADVPAAATALSGDMFLGQSTWKWMDLHRQAGAPTYYYLYAHVRPRFLADTSGAPLAWGAVHSAEIEYALGNLDANPAYAWADDDRRVSATLHGYFVNFIKTGDPNGAGLPAWPKAAQDAAAIQRQRIDVQTRTEPFLEQRRYVAAEALLPPR